jgi:hypothetical protein
MRYRSRRDLERHCAAAQRLLPQLVERGQLRLDGAPVIIKALTTRSDVVVILLGTAASEQARVALKLPLTEDARRSLERHQQVITALHERQTLASFGALLPHALAWGRHEGQLYYLETALPGKSAQELLGRPELVRALQSDAACALQLLQEGSVQRRLVDEACFMRLAGTDLALLEELAGGWPEAMLLQRKLDRLGELLRCELQGRELPLTWIHGDFWLGNLLACSEGSTLSGVIDWDRAAPDELPLHDQLHLLVYTRKLARNTELGEEIAGYLLPASFETHERALLDAAMARLTMPNTEAFLRAAALLYWLRFVGANLSRYPARRSDGKWLNKNVFLVLKRGL